MEKEKNMIEKYDANMRPNSKLEGNIRWYSPLEQPFRVCGLAWFEQERIYRRLPLNPSSKIPEAVDRLADHTAGGQIRFQTDSPSLAGRWFSSD